MIALSLNLRKHSLNSTLKVISFRRGETIAGLQYLEGVYISCPQGVAVEDYIIFINYYKGRNYEDVIYGSSYGCL